MYEKFQWYVHVIFVFIHKKMIREEGKNLEFTSSDEDSFLMCAVLTPSFIICRWRLMLNSSY